MRKHKFKIFYLLLLLGIGYQQHTLERKLEATQFILGQLYQNEIKHFYAQKYSTKLYFYEVQ